MYYRILRFHQSSVLALCLAWMISFPSWSFSTIQFEEKRTEVVLRLIGHEILKCSGDDDSRILPIEKLEDSYKISFESSFGFDPDDIIRIVETAMTQNDVKNVYIVEVQRCVSNEVVHGFALAVAGDEILPCKGRIMPKDCYDLVVTVLDPEEQNAQLLAGFDDQGPTSLSQAKQSSIFQSPLFISCAILTVGLILFLVQRRSEDLSDPFLVSIGSSRFDKRNMTLNYADQEVELSSKEAALLELLHNCANQPIEREVILQKVWGDDGDYVGRTLDVFISKLRKKLAFDSNVKIVNIRGVGYKLISNK